MRSLMPTAPRQGSPMNRRLIVAAFIACLAVYLVHAQDLDASKLPPASASPVDFRRDVQPILESRCLKCHGGEKPKGKFSLGTRAKPLKNGQNGPNLVAGDGGKSRFLTFHA